MSSFHSCLARTAILYVGRCGLLLQTEYRDLSVSQSLCLSVTVVSPAKTAEPIEMPFGLWARMGGGGSRALTPVNDQLFDMIQHSPVSISIFLYTEASLHAKKLRAVQWVVALANCWYNSFLYSYLEQWKSCSRLSDVRWTSTAVHKSSTRNSACEDDSNGMFKKFKTLDTQQTLGTVAY